MQTDLQIERWRPLLQNEAGARALAAAREIAERLLALHGGDTGGLPEITGGREASIARGPAGLALCFAYLDRASPECGYAEAAAHHLERALELLAAVPMDASLYEGFAGIGWAMAHLHQQLLDCDEDPVESIDEALLEFLQRPSWDGEYDLMSGLVGLGVYGLERLPRPTGVACVERVIDHLEATAVTGEQGVAWFSRPGWSPLLTVDFPRGYFDTGVAHGQAGIIAFLGRACAAGVHVHKARPLLDQAVAWLLNQKADAAYVFPDCVTADKQKGRTRLGWCYGDLGIAAALLGAARNVNEPAWEREAIAVGLRAAARRPEAAGVAEDGLCHGAAGLAHLFNRMYQATNEPRFKQAAEMWFERLFTLRRGGEGIAGFVNFGHEGEVFFLDTGLYRGAAGIAMALLAAATGIEPNWDRMMLLPAKTAN